MPSACLAASLPLALLLLSVCFLLACPAVLVEEPTEVEKKAQPKAQSKPQPRRPSAQVTFADLAPQPPPRPSQGPSPEGHQGPES